MTNPDFESTSQYEPAYLALSADLTDDVRFRGPSDRTECLTALFNPLPATSVEGQAIADLLRQNTGLGLDYIAGAEASESRLKNLSGAPSILHLATHGYYCSGAGFADYEQIAENPLLYTGLALSGANRAIAGELDPTVDLEDGILTSLEASGLDLYGTDLVVLSACQTGLGEVANGEGVYGLRRAFQLAGANSVIMSMFNIPDQSTVSLMEKFYSNWLSGDSKSTALRDASLAVINERRQSSGTAHPLFWGGFILVGDPD
jgi:CHAT domain-containing protein